jgi:hypothetical protein
MTAWSLRGLKGGKRRPTTKVGEGGWLFCCVVCCVLCCVWCVVCCEHMAVALSSFGSVASGPDVVVLLGSLRCSGLLAWTLRAVGKGCVAGCSAGVLVASLSHPLSPSLPVCVCVRVYAALAVSARLRRVIVFWACHHLRSSTSIGSLRRSIACTRCADRTQGPSRRSTKGSSPAGAWIGFGHMHLLDLTDSL